ncbi:MAG: GAF domain-containing protein [Candidatus Rokuibacteriota bacterium]|nr:MAG: GAF domain-containing protein [Candidatus Rokubacteria bacterium]
MSSPLVSASDLQSSLMELAKEFPFECELSLQPLISFWEQMGAREDSLLGRLAGVLERELRQAPELSEPIRDLDVLARHAELVEALMAAVFPAVFWEQEHAAALIPFQLKSFYSTPAFANTLMGADGRLRGRLNVDKRTLSRFRLLNAYSQVLWRVHDIDFPVDYPLIFTTDDRETGLDRHFKIFFDGRFVEVEAAGPAPALTADVRARLEAGSADLDTLAALIPPGSFRFRGFTVFRALDVTDQEVLSSLKRDLIDKESIISNARFEGLQAKLCTLFRRPELRLGLAAIEGDRVLSLNYGARFDHSCIFADSVHHKVSDFEGSIYMRASLQRQPLFIEDLATYGEPRTDVEDGLIKSGVRSIVVAPLHYQEQTIGTLELSSPNSGDLTALHAPKLDEVLPLFSMAVKRSMDELDNRVQAFIKEQCTAIHPVVEWRFRKAVFDGLERQGAAPGAVPTEMEPIVFRDVHPLYAIADIRGSSTQRSWSIQADLLAQLGLARDILRAAHDVRPLPILDQLTYRIDAHVADLEVSLRSGDEMAVIVFLRTDIESLFDHLQTFGAGVRERIEAYRRAVDPRVGTVYAKRREFDESVTLITEAISGYIDLENQAAQAMCPHYFEKQKTDGVDYSIYAGGSLLEDGAFDPLYLKNLRLWQLMVAGGVAIRAERLKDRLSVPLEVTNLILVQHAPLAIRFRFDEKRFDVDGAYNVRYEIIKKRIDKAVIRGTTERLTQPGQIALVYSHASEAGEWRDYIEYLQKRGHLARDVEDLELEELQGTQGLRALRVGVDLTRRDAATHTSLAELAAGLS